MRRMTNILLSLFLVLTFFSPHRAPAAEKPLVLLTEYRVYPAKIVEFGGIIQQFIKWYREYRLGYPIRIYFMDDYTGHTMHFLKDYADLDRLTLAFQKVIAKAGEERWVELSKKKSACYSRYASFILRHCPDISLKPNQQKYPPDTTHFTYWGYYYLLPERETEFRAAFKDIIAFYHTLDFRDIDYGWDFYYFEAGPDKPLYLMIHPGKNVVDFWQQAGKRQGVAGKKLNVLFARVMETVRAFEVKTGDYLPDLSLPAE